MANIFGEILEWSKELTPWQNEAIRRLFKNGGLSQSDQDEIFRVAKIENGLELKPTQPLDLMLKPAELPTPPSAGVKIILKGVRELLNVNALKKDQRLSIGKQFTGIYGENGAGKSGYVRVMKRACRARAVDPILPDVYGKASDQPASAIFEIEENGVARDENWIEGTSVPECLGRFAVFDSRCGRVYVSEDNELGFLPYGFDIIKGVSAITDEVKRRFQQLAIPPKTEFLTPFLDNTETGKKLAALSASTNEATIKSLGDWTADHEKTLSAKETELATLKTKSPQAIRDALVANKKRLQTVAAAVNDSLAAVSNEKLNEIKNKAAEVRKFDQAVAAAAKLAFGEMDLPGIGGDAWRELVLAAAAFSTKEAYAGQPFPAPMADAKCVLCLQPVDEKTHARLKGFWDFIMDDTSSKRENAKVALNAEITLLKKVPREIPKEISVLEDAFRETESKVYDFIPAYYQSLDGRVKAIEDAIAKDSWVTIPSLAQLPTEQCDTEITAIDKRLSELQDDKKVAELVQTLTNVIGNLKAHQRLNAHLQSVLEYLAALKISTVASSAAGKTTTNAISIKAGALQDKYVTEEFIRATYDELAQFGLPRVKPRMDKRSAKGKVLFKLNVESGSQNVSLESVFSEGERTAISLACFLAELSIGKDNCGIILDDPVSSLDHRVREKIVNRLVAEAKNRQVIVFTHNLVFHRELETTCEQQNISYEFQCIESLGPVIGIISNTPPWDSMKVGQRISKLDEKLAKLKAAETAGDIKTYRQLFREFYSELRSTWERSVEELLFNQVVQRMEKEVKTMSLDEVFVDSESVEQIFGGMTQTSKMIDAHDHAVAIGSALPASNDLTTDLADLKTYVKKQKAKQTTAKEQNAHLKK